MAKTDHLETVSCLMKEMHSIKLDDHCLICLNQEETSVSNPKDIGTFQPLMCYLTGTRHADETSNETGSDTIPTGKQIPPLCHQCYDLASELYVLHQQLLDVQQKIQEKTRLLRSVVKRTMDKRSLGEMSNGGQGPCLSAAVSHIRAVDRFRRKLHDQIIDAGDRIYFPVGCCQEPDSFTVQKDPEPGNIKTEWKDESDEEMGTILDPLPLECNLDEHNSHSVSVSADDSITDDDGEVQVQVAETVKIVESSRSGQKILIKVNQPEPARSRKSQVKVAPAQVLITPIAKCTVPAKAPRLNLSTDYKTEEVPLPSSTSEHVKPVLLKVTQGDTSSFIKAEVAQQSNQCPARLKPIRPKSSNSQKCDICGDKYPVGPRLHQHLKNHVGPDYVFSCNICNHAFVSSFRFNAFHLKTLKCSNTLQVTDIMHECTVCPMKTSKTKIFKNHFQKHEDTAFEKPFSCPLCSAKFACKKSVEIHLEGKHLCHSMGESQKCELCEVTTPITDMREHFELVHDLFNSLKCKLCSARYVTAEKMMAHQLHHRKLTKIMACHLCDERFTILRDFQIHFLKLHGIGQKFNCEKCKWECYSEVTLKKHKEKCFQKETRSGGHSLIDNSTPRYCCPEPNCDKSFAKENTVLQHRIREHGHPPIECPYATCDKTYTNPNELRKHTVSVHGGISFCKVEIQSCDECGESSFKSVRELEQHKLVKHSTETPFICETCGKGFRLKATLRSHNKVKHLKTKKVAAPSKRVVCDTCGKRVANLQEHMLTHTKDRPFSCHLCGQKFRQRIAWRTHVKSHERLGDQFKPKGPMERGVRKHH